MVREMGKSRVPMLSAIASIFTESFAKMKPNKKKLDFKNFNLIAFLNHVKKFAPLSGHMTKFKHNYENPKAHIQKYTKHNRRFERNRIYKNLSFKKGELDGTFN